MKKALSLFLTLCMVLSLFTVSAYAAGGTKAPIDDGYYLIGRDGVWDESGIRPEDQFIPSYGQNTDEWILETELVQNEQFKAVHVESGAITQWIPGGDNYYVNNPGSAIIYINPGANTMWVGFKGTSYIDENGDSVSCSDYVTANWARETWDGSSDELTVLVHENTTVNERIEVMGKVRLILQDGCTLKALSGVHIREDASLKIYAQSAGSGTLYADTLAYFNTLDPDVVGPEYFVNIMMSVFGSAGIGGNSNEEGGAIVIAGGNIYACGGDGGAGIGGGQAGSMENIVIYNGVIEAYGGDSCGDGIGSGDSAGSCADIDIFGGTITAVGSANNMGTGAGIGCYQDSVLNISGGTIVAKGGYENNTGYGGAGIGGNFVNGTAGTINISGGSVTAVGSRIASGIGGANGGCGTINISGGVVNAQNGFSHEIAGEINVSAAIGMSPQAPSGETGLINITGGQITASASDDGVGICCFGDISLSWTNDNDFIKSDSYFGTVKLVKAFASDGEDLVFEAGELSDPSVLNAKKLIPYTPPRIIKVFFVADDPEFGTDGGFFYAFNEPNNGIVNASWPGESIGETIGNDEHESPVFVFEVNADLYNSLVISNANGWQTLDINNYADNSFNTDTFEYIVLHGLVDTENGKHKYEFKDDVRALTDYQEPGCVTNGYAKYKSYVTGEETDEIFVAVGHQFGDWTITLHPTDTTHGEKTRTCALCGEVETQDILPNGYYLNGTPNNWDIAELTEAYHFAANLDNQGEYLLNFHLDLNDAFKVVNLYDGVITGWFPGGDASDYVIQDLLHAGNVTVYFRPDGLGDQNYGWHYGYILINAGVSLTIRNTLALESDTSLNYYIVQSELDAYLNEYNVALTDVSFVVERYVPGQNDPENHTFTNPSITTKGGVTYYVYSFPNIPAKQLNDRMVAHIEFTANGNVVASAPYDYNPISFCYQAAKNADGNIKLRRACADLIRYASAAQTKFGYNDDNLPDAPEAGWDAVMESLVTNPDVSAVNNSDKGTLGNSLNISSITLALEGRVELNLYLEYAANAAQLDLSTLKLHYSYTNISDQPIEDDIPASEWAAASNGRYVAAFAKLSAGEIFNQVTFSVIQTVDGVDTVISNVYTLSVSDYAAYVISMAGSNQTAAALAPLMQKLLNYGDSAHDYLH